jgi:ribosomal protein S18 acetylase RimI-like enzyme
MPLRRGRIADLPALLELEADCFEPRRRDSRAVTRRSLVNPLHEVWVLDGQGGRLDAALFLRFHPRTCRIHSIAVAPSARGGGLGHQLLDHARSRAVDRGCARIHLEASARDHQLVEWYRRSGYRVIARLPDYYARRWHGLRMALPLAGRC